MWHRPLSEMLTDVFSAVDVVQTPGMRIRPRQVELKLPIEIGLRDVGGELTFIADLPLWAWRTHFDQRPSQLQITYVESKL